MPWSAVFVDHNTSDLGSIGEISLNEPVQVNDSTFEKAVVQSPLPVLADFWAPRCGPCRLVVPSLEKLAKEYAGKMVAVDAPLTQAQIEATLTEINYPAARAA